MSLAAGTRLGVNEILSQLGACGTGEVREARDPRPGSTLGVVTNGFEELKPRVATK